MLHYRASSRATVAVTAVSMFIMAAAACATSSDTVVEDDDGGPTGVTSTGGAGGSSTVGTGGAAFPCGVDCAAIAAPDCQVAQCNMVTKNCEVVNDENGVACEDGVFCTISDTCVDGMCVGGPQNDCGMTPPQCTEVTCDEPSQTCGTMPSANGAPCQEPNLCIKGSTCTNGLCLGGMLDNCFFEPVPDDCHVSVCDTADGICKPEIGNFGGPCSDLNDLCTVNKTCDNMGMCQGGDPKDCSALTMDCTLGVCDTLTGNCNPQAVMNGQPCDDLDGCTTGEICNNNVCSGGTLTTVCANNDNCCPTNCNQTNDNDCGLVPGNVTNIASRGGYQVQCTLWQGNVCREMWVKMNEPDVFDPSPHCIDDTTSLRPVWFGNAALQAPAICWIATGNANVISTGIASSSTSPLCGWMYSGSSPTCTGQRRYSTVQHPVVGPITWSFDLMSFCRVGTFTFYECNW